MGMVTIEWNQWSVNWPPSFSYTSSWNSNKPRQIQNYRSDTQPACVVCPFRRTHLGLVVVAVDNDSKGGDGNKSACRNIMNVM